MQEPDFTASGENLCFSFENSTSRWSQERETRSVSRTEVIREEKLLNSRMIHKLSRNRKGARTTVAASQREGAPEGSIPPPLPLPLALSVSSLPPPGRAPSISLNPLRHCLIELPSELKLAGLKLPSHFYQILLIKPSVVDYICNYFPEIIKLKK